MTAPRIQILPDVRRRRITVKIDAPQDAEVSLSVEGQNADHNGPPDTIKLDLPDCADWSIEKPNLYRLTGTVKVGSESHDVSISFGLRELTTKESRFFFNTRPLLIKAVQHGPAEGSPAPEKVPYIKQELTFARDTGFNAVDLATVFPLETYGESDALGIMVFQQLPEDWDEDFVRTLWNHTSIVAWKLGRTSRERVHALQKLDPGRLLFFEDENGHHVIKPYREETAPLDLVEAYQRAPLDTYSQSYLSHMGEPERLTWVSACGYGGLTLDPKAKDDGMTSALADDLGKRDMGSMFADPIALAKECQLFQGEAVQGQMDAVRNNSKVAGYSFNRLRDDAHYAHMGLLNGKYETKPVTNTLKHVNEQVRPLIQFHQRNLTPRESTHVTVNLANETKMEGRADLSLQVVGPTNQVLWKKKRNIKIPKNGKLLWDGSIAASGSPGVHKFVVRVLKDMKRIAENSVEFYVYPEVSRWDGTVNVLDPSGIWKHRYSPLVSNTSVLAPVHIIPPLANTIRAYPDNELAQILGQVHDGATALFFAPPPDWNDLAQIVDADLCVQSHRCTAAQSGTVHYAKLHPLFDNLPARCLMGATYSNVAPAMTFAEPGDEDISGSFQLTNEPGSESAVWGSDVLVKRYGDGRIIFTHLNIMEHLGSDVVADHLFVNMLKHVARRSLASRGTLAVHQRSVEWLRGERKNNTHRWMVLGMFPNWEDAGIDAAFSPEETIDFDATYPGWYRSLNWHSWYTTAANQHVLDFAEALAPVYSEQPDADSGIAYAYAEVSCDNRCEVSLLLRTENPVKVFLNGHLVGHSAEEPVPETLSLKQGRNSLLVKISKYHQECRLELDLKATEMGSALNWWK